MPNLGTVLRAEIARLSRREVRKETQHAKRIAVQHRHHIAALNRKVAELERVVTTLARRAAATTHSTPAESQTEGRQVRFVAKGLRSHRNRLGLSAGEFGRLLGVSANSVYAWESGATSPRRQQVMKIAGLRGIGKREALQRLEAMRLAKGPARRTRTAKGSRSA